MGSLNKINEIAQYSEQLGN